MLIDLKPEQVEAVKAALANEIETWDGADVEPPEENQEWVGHLKAVQDVLDYPPLPTAYVAEVETFDGLYLFQSEEDRDRFVRVRGGVSDPEQGLMIATGDSPINDAQTAQHLISSEAAMRLEEES